MARSVKSLKKLARQLHSYLQGKLQLDNSEIFILANFLETNALIDKMNQDKKE